MSAKADRMAISDVQPMHGVGLKQGAFGSEWKRSALERQTLDANISRIGRRKSARPVAAAQDGLARNAEEVGAGPQSQTPRRVEALRQKQRRAGTRRLVERGLQHGGLIDAAAWFDRHRSGRCALSAEKGRARENRKSASEANPHRFAPVDRHLLLPLGRSGGGHARRPVSSRCHSAFAHIDPSKERIQDRCRSAPKLGLGERVAGARST